MHKRNKKKIEIGSRPRGGECQLSHAQHGKSNDSRQSRLSPHLPPPDPPAGSGHAPVGAANRLNSVTPRTLKRDEKQAGTQSDNRGSARTKMRRRGWDAAEAACGEGFTATGRRAAAAKGLCPTALPRCGGNVARRSAFRRDKKKGAGTNSRSKIVQKTWTNQEN